MNRWLLPSLWRSCNCSEFISSQDNCFSSIVIVVYCAWNVLHVIHSCRLKAGGSGNKFQRNSRNLLYLCVFVHESAVFLLYFKACKKRSFLIHWHSSLKQWQSKHLIQRNFGVTKIEICMAEHQLQMKKKQLFNKCKMSQIFFFSFSFSDTHKWQCVCVCVCVSPVWRAVLLSLSYSLWCHRYVDGSPNPDAATCSKSTETSCSTSQQLMSQTHSEHHPCGQVCNHFVFLFIS